ncbi:MAG: membrane protein insertion efficiency factor YidD [Frankiales bacterium]|nr:membrane protein insertion efficiency factor YidD [Frankiales bacterium]
MTPLRAVRRALDATVGRVLRWLLTGLIVGYRTFLSPLLGPRCRFYPSCSAYGLEAISVHGAAKGTALTVARICRCNPWNAGGVDHVPPRGRWRPDPYISLESASGGSGASTPGPDAGGPTAPDAGTRAPAPDQPGAGTPAGTLPPTHDRSVA